MLRIISHQRNLKLQGDTTKHPLAWLKVKITKTFSHVVGQMFKANSHVSHAKEYLYNLKNYNLFP